MSKSREVMKIILEDLDIFDGSISYIEYCMELLEWKNDNRVVLNMFGFINNLIILYPKYLQDFIEKGYMTKF